MMRLYIFEHIYESGAEGRGKAKRIKVGERNARFLNPSRSHFWKVSVWDGLLEGYEKRERKKSWYRSLLRVTIGKNDKIRTSVAGRHRLKRR